MIQPLVPTIPLAIVEWIERLFPAPMPGAIYDHAAGVSTYSHDFASLAAMHGAHSVALTVRWQYNQQRQKRPGDLEGVPTVIA